MAPALAASVARVIGRSLRLHVAGLPDVAPYWARREPVIYVAWHARSMLLPWLGVMLGRTRGARMPRILVSRSADGALAAGFARRFGLDVIRGSSSRGGSTAFRGLLRALALGHDVAVIGDGPRGPAERLKPGAVALAAMSGAPAVPLGFAAAPAWRLPSWDRTLVPCVFARACLTFGAPIHVGRAADRDAALAGLEDALRATTLAADRRVARRAEVS